jgi:uncharacterized protein YkwD
LVLSLALSCDADTNDEGSADAEARAIVPFSDYCSAVRPWSDAWVDAEQDVLARLDDYRTRGQTCGALGRPGPAPALRLDGRLTCAARVHALAMATRGFEGHIDPEDGSDAQQRATTAMYDATVVEHWAAGPADAEALVDTLWLPSDAHCADLMARDFVDVGIAHLGEIDGDHGTYWVVVVGAGAPLP